ncbi:ABC transporter substrate-binding protein [Microbacteriaceae bacterium VKM Ac-2854]|nr:ABC transporter substrate-binding protein [Microbacteriaceae bacterium VKM Ac-2854]
MAAFRTRRTATLSALAAVAAASALVLSGCSSSLNDTGGDAAASGDCGTTNLAMNNWVGYTADAAVYTAVAESLGCTVTQKSISEEVAWQGFGTGEVDAIIENWGHPDLVEKYIDGDKSAVDLGPTGNVGQIGWYVPPWMVEEYPDILDWNNLNKYADLFKTTESGDKGQLLDGDPSFVTNDEALVKNLNLNYQVVYSGSETALITGFRAAEENKTPMLGYFYAPQWFLSEVDLQKVALPEYTDGCDADAEAIACDYPDYTLNKIASASWVESDTPAVKLLQAFEWTNDDQNLVAKYISEDGMSAEDAAAKWIADNPDTVKTWTDAATS